MSLDLSSSFHQFRISMAEGSKSGNFAFDNFKIDVGKLMLYRDDEELSLAPKVVKTLAVLVVQAGTIISKDELIERVWDDSIVEESNLTQYLYLLRKTLQTMPDGRPYIETLRRRGYRFNGDVQMLSEEVSSPAPDPVRHRPEAAQFGAIERDGNVLRVIDWKKPDRDVEQHHSEAEAASATITATPTRSSFIPRIAIAAGTLLVIGALGIFLWPRFMPAATNAETPKEVSVVRLTNGQMPHGATISRDGNVFAYQESNGGVSRLYVQQTGQTTSRIEIASSADRIFDQSTFAPDGRSVYYVSVDTKTGVSTLYRSPTMGGASVRVLGDIHGAASFSPDGKELVFCRRNDVLNESSLVIAGSDGGSERVILQRKSPKVLASSPAWSPDGKVIVFSEMDAASGHVAGAHQLQTLQVATGRVVPLSDEGWDNTLRLAWLPDGSGIVLIGTRKNDGYSTRRDQVYYVAYPSGVSKRVTTDGNRHEPHSLGVTNKGDILVVPGNRSAQIWVMNADGNSNTAVQLTKGAADGRAGLGPLPDGRFGYLARTGEEITIMLSGADAVDTKELATGYHFVEELRSDPQGRFFIFSTMEDGKSHMYRIDIEGGAVEQLTSGDSREIDSTISPDGKYLVYDSASYVDGVETFVLKRIPTGGGEPVALQTRNCYAPTYSPDGSLISCVSLKTPEVVVVSAADGAEVERHRLPVFATSNFGIGWTADGSGLIYIVNEKGTSNLWIQPRDGGKPRSLTNISSGIIYRYALSTDGSRLFVACGYPTQDAILISNYR
jgi:Tol biopolymer transport system component/DNA-binding winged helix-turn-helix (wHTH) protein